MKLFAIILLSFVYSTVTDIDGNVYETVLIGDQLWMAENLKVTHYNDGSEIPTDYSNEEWGELETGAFSVYDDEPENAITYANLYNWYAVDDDRGVCPEGWHVPSDVEYTVLIDYLGGESVAGGKMKECTEGSCPESEYWNIPNTGATNDSGFTALPGGKRSSETGIPVLMGGYAYFWSSIEINDVNAWYYLLESPTSDIYPSDYSKKHGFSVRCLQDDIEGCTNPDASNYDENAEVDDGSCCVELWGECYNIEETTNLSLHYSLTGEIPPEIGNLTNLTYLSLRDNELQGEIPSEIGQLTNLINLELDWNQLTGSIPSEIENLTNLELLELHHNELSGEIPNSICDLSNSQILLENNHFCPPYPECLSEEDIGYQECCEVLLWGECYNIGDLNGDATINVTDVVLLIEVVLYIAEGGEPTEEQLQLGDIYPDGQLNVIDIVGLVNIILDL